MLSYNRTCSAIIYYYQILTSSSSCICERPSDSARTNSAFSSVRSDTTPSEALETVNQYEKLVFY